MYVILSAFFMQLWDLCCEFAIQTPNKYIKSLNNHRNLHPYRQSTYILSSFCENIKNHIIVYKFKSDPALQFSLGIASLKRYIFKV